MPTQTKIDEVARLKEKLESAVSLVLADYRGLTANEMVELREKFSKQGLEYRVVKDTLARLAADAAGIEGLAELFAGPISIAFGYEDPAGAFRLSEECRKTYAPRYELRGGVFEGALVLESEVARYASLPSREELLAKLAMLLSSPMTALAVMLKAKIRELATVLGEVAKVREQEPVPEEELASDEQPASEEEPDSQEAQNTQEGTEPAEEPETEGQQEQAEPEEQPDSEDQQEEPEPSDQPEEAEEQEQQIEQEEEE